jgi:hypothetical protein
MRARSCRWVVTAVSQVSLKHAGGRHSISLPSAVLICCAEVMHGVWVSKGQAGRPLRFSL